jgi:hypothetical protein
MLTHQMMIDRETNWVNNYFSTGIWTTEYDGVANADNNQDTEVTHWDDYDNSTPIIDVTTAKRTAMLASGGFKPNVMVVTRDVRDALVNHPNILARLVGGATVTDTALVTDSKLAEIFEVQEFLVADAMHNVAAEGAAEDTQFIATKRAALYYRPVGLRVLGFLPLVTTLLGQVWITLRAMVLKLNPTLTMPLLVRVLQKSYMLSWHMTRRLLVQKWAFTSTLSFRKGELDAF